MTDPFLVLDERDAARKELREIVEKVDRIERLLYGASKVNNGSHFNIPLARELCDEILKTTNGKL